jgi:D-alanyl-D-alanine carboxypeptidase
MTDKVLVANPALANPVQDASEISPEGGRRNGVANGRIALAGGYASHGEAARMHFDGRGRAKTVWLGGTELVAESRAARELARRYPTAPAAMPAAATPRRIRRR